MDANKAWQEMMEDCGVLHHDAALKITPKMRAESLGKAAYRATQKALTNNSSGSHHEAAAAHDAAAKAWRAVGGPGADARAAHHLGTSGLHERDKANLETWEERDQHGRGAQHSEDLRSRMASYEKVSAGEWDESKHPRDENGKFT